MLSDDLARAFDRVDDFQSVQAGADYDELKAAAECLQESVGIGAEERALIAARLESLQGTRRGRGRILLGMILGLMAAERP